MTMTEALNDPSITAKLVTEKQTVLTECVSSSFSVAHEGTQEENDFELALALSEAMAAESNAKRGEEDEELQRVLRLSLEEK